MLISYFQCRQGNHCGSGMVFAINSDETSGRNFAAFQNVAKALNSTSLPVNAPSPSGTGTPAPGSGAGSLKVGGAAVSVVVAAIISYLL